MKTSILISTILLACLVIPSPRVARSEKQELDNHLIKANFKMELFVDGIQQEGWMLVELEMLPVILDVKWNHIALIPDHNTKRVDLRAFHYSSTEHSISDVVIKENYFSFTMGILADRDYSRKMMRSSGLSESEIKRWLARNASNDYRVVGHKKNDGSGYSVEAVAFFWNSTEQKTIKHELRTTDKKIILPYKEVY